MFKKYGILGIIIILLVELNFVFKIEPFASWYFPIIWIGYIFVIDALIFMLNRKSPMMNNGLEFFFLFIASIPLWYVFEIFNVFVANWNYNSEFTSLIRLVSAIVLLPAVYETYLLIRALHLFDKIKLKKSYKISKPLLYGLIVLGLICFILPVFFPKQTFPLIWLSFFFILDPINYLHKQPSIIGHLKDRKLTIPISLMLSGLVSGFLWEFWNFWAVPKWFYTIPVVGFIKIFEMPILGYLGYMPFAFEFYAMYWFIRYFFGKKKHLLDK